MPDAGTTMGVVSGPLSTTRSRQRWWGLPVLGAVLVVGGVLLVLSDLRGRPGSVLIGTAFAAAGALISHQVWQRASVVRAGTLVTERRFRVQDMAGTIVTCRLDGEVPGAGIRHGDILRFTGRPTRDGQLVVRRFDVLATPSGPVLHELTTRRPLRLVLARWADRACYGAAGLAALWTALALTGLVP